MATLINLNTNQKVPLMNSWLGLSVDFDLQMGLHEWLINGREQVSVKDLSVLPSSFSSALPGVTVHSFLLIRTISSPDVPGKINSFVFLHAWRPGSHDRS